MNMTTPKKNAKNSIKIMEHITSQGENINGLKSALVDSLIDIRELGIVKMHLRNDGAMSKEHSSQPGGAPNGQSWNDLSDKINNDSIKL